MRSGTVASSGNLGHCQSIQFVIQKENNTITGKLACTSPFIQNSCEEISENVFSILGYLQFFCRRICVEAGRMRKSLQKIRLFEATPVVQLPGTICFATLYYKHGTSTVTNFWCLGPNIVTGYFSPRYLVLEWHS